MRCGYGPIQDQGTIRPRWIVRASVSQLANRATRMAMWLAIFGTVTAAANAQEEVNDSAFVESTELPAESPDATAIPTSDPGVILINPDVPPAPGESIADPSDIPQVDAGVRPTQVTVYTTTQPILRDDLTRLIPDPIQVNNRDLPDREQIYLTLEEAIRRTLRNSLRIRIEGFNPAVRQAEIVQAEAAFDATFFTEFGYGNTDTPPATDLTADGTQTDGWQFQSGLRQRLATGAALEGRWEYNSLFTEPRQQYVHYPAVQSNFVAELRQPLLRNFGLDVNRAEINTRKNDRRTALYTFSREVRDVLNEVHRRYWELAFARRNVVITRELLEQTKNTLQLYRSRFEAGLDALPVQLTRVQALLGSREAEFIRAKNAVADAEDVLKNLINDPDLNLAVNIEIIPVDEPIITPIVTERLAEIQTAIANREELQEARLAIENARIAVGVSRNQLLPQFDALLRFTVRGADENFSAATSESLTGDYFEVFVGASFEIPIGNRAAEAQYRVARLRLSQSLAALRRVIEEIILDVNTSVRQFTVSAEQIRPSREAAQAARENVEVIVARVTAFDPPFLDTLLSAQETLASSRRALLQALVDYNISLANLERAKGTLLKYYNVVLTEEQLLRNADGRENN